MYNIWVFPKIMVPQNGWLIKENPIKMDDLGVPLFLETPILYIYIYDRRAKTHERFYMIEVHRHRFARHARKVPFEKCEHWRKVCGRSAKDQIASTL